MGIGFEPGWPMVPGVDAAGLNLLNHNEPWIDGVSGRRDSCEMGCW